MYASFVILEDTIIHIKLHLLFFWHVGLPYVAVSDGLTCVLPLFNLPLA